jgi:hypothetical protein
MEEIKHTTALPLDFARPPAEKAAKKA